MCIVVPCDRKDDDRDSKNDIGKDLFRVLGQAAFCEGRKRIDGRDRGCDSGEGREQVILIIR